jgi:glycosyltransferase involved in cell wall biosynthesis
MASDTSSEMRAHPRVSIVIANYNYGRFIGETLDSALAQSYDNTEIIVVDDGSTDDSREVIGRYGDRLITHFTPNRGQTDAAHTGYALSSGDIVLFLDSDDVLFETAVEEVVTAWETGAAKLQFRLSIIDGQSRARGLAIPAFPRGFSREDVRKLVRAHGIYPSPPTSGNAYARGFLEQVMPLDTTLFPTMADGALNTIAPLYGDVISLDKPLGGYRIHGENMWAADTVEAERYLAYVAQGRLEEAFLRDRAASLNVALSEDSPLDHSLSFLERRLIARKLAPADPLVAHEQPLRLFLCACRCVNREMTGVGRRAVTLAWFLGVALLPPQSAKRLIKYRYEAVSRPPLVQKIVKLFKRMAPQTDRHIAQARPIWQQRSTEVTSPKKRA